MKKIILFVLVCAASITGFSQSLNYQDLGLLFSKDNGTGTARFNAMSGAFGALGGDLSAIAINPAGGAVYKYSEAAFSLNTRNTNIKNSYYGNSTNTVDNLFGLSQAGVIFVFSDYNMGNWKKLALSVNYNKSADFRNEFIAAGNSGYATFIEFPLDNATPTTQYTNADSQKFVNTYLGSIDEYNFAVSGLYQDNLYLGIGLNTYGLNFSQKSTLTEFNNDGNGNQLAAKFYQQNFTSGNGFSLNMGAIFKATKSLRLGFSYQTPSWFSEINEETNIIDNDGFMGDTEISVSNHNTIYDNTTGGYYPSQYFLYKLKTPGKFTASFAYIFGTNGLLSIDYIHKNYQNIKLSGDDFSTENQFFANDLKNTSTVNIGTEWRFKTLSIRGGYHFEQSPDKNAIATDNIKGYSLGAGFKFGYTTLDFSYQKNAHTSLYNFYPQYNQVNASELNIDNQIITATIVFSL